MGSGYAARVALRPESGPFYAGRRDIRDPPRRRSDVGRVRRAGRHGPAVARLPLRPHLADPAGALPWLISSWTCIFGRGCRGIDAGRPDDGCCTLGAHFSDADDERRVGRAVRRPSPEGWGHHAQGRGGRWRATDADADGARTTAVVDGACVFLNRP